MAKIKKVAASHTDRGIIRVLNLLNLTLPKELQLPRMGDAPSMNAVKTRFAELDAQVRKLKARVATPRQSEAAPALNEKMLASIATNAWRAEKRVLDPQTREPRAEMRMLGRDIGAIREGLQQLGMELTDPTGHKYDPGLALKVVASEPTEGLTEDTITETIKPTIRWQGKFIQIGEVIVGTPKGAASAERGKA